MNTARIFLFSALLIASCQPKEKTDVAGSVYSIVSDDANILSDSEEQKITSLIRELGKNVGSQLAIVTIDSLNGEKIEAFSLRTVTDMKLGRRNFNDGVLIAVALKERTVRIEVGYGLEKIIKDEIASRIILEEIGPRFKEEKFYEGLYAAVEKIRKLIEENKDLVGQAP